MSKCIFFSYFNDAHLKNFNNFPCAITHEFYISVLQYVCVFRTIIDLCFVPGLKTNNRYVSRSRESRPAIFLRDGRTRRDLSAATAERAQMVIAAAHYYRPLEFVENWPAGCSRYFLCSGAGNKYINDGCRAATSRTRFIRLYHAHDTYHTARLYCSPRAAPCGRDIILFIRLLLYFLLLLGTPVRRGRATTVKINPTVPTPAPPRTPSLRPTLILQQLMAVTPSSFPHHSRRVL